MTENDTPRDEHTTPGEHREHGARNQGEYHEEPRSGPGTEEPRSGAEDAPAGSQASGIRAEHTRDDSRESPSQAGQPGTADSDEPHPATGESRADSDQSREDSEQSRSDSDWSRSADDEVRTESWPCPGPAELDVSVEVGRIDVALSDTATSVDVELRAEQRWGGGWHKGLSNVFSWLNEATGGSTSIRIGGREISFGGLGGGHFDLRDLAGRDLVSDAIEDAEVTWSEAGRRLVVHTARTLPARLVPLAVTVRAPTGSRVVLRTASGGITVTGRAGGADVRTGSGDIELDTVTGDLKLRTGSGAATVHTVSGRGKAKTGSGEITVDAVDGPVEVQSGSGDLRLGTVRADVFARTGSGDLSIADAEAGRLDLTAGSGTVRVGVHPGVTAEVDLRAGSGRARSELDVHDTAPVGGRAALRVSARSGNGDIVVTRALSAAGAAG